MVTTPVLDGLIIKDPTLRGGRPIITGTGTTVRTIAGLYKLGLSAEEITGELPLTLAQVYAALTYYHLHSAEIETDIQADAEDVLMNDPGLKPNCLKPVGNRGDPAPFVQVIKCPVCNGYA